MVSTAAKHANDAMKRIEKFKKLLEVQESLGGTVDLVSPTRELLKEGKMVKISARSGDHQDRYIFLVSFFDISGQVILYFRSEFLNLSISTNLLFPMGTSLAQIDCQQKQIATDILKYIYQKSK